MAQGMDEKALKRQKYGIPTYSLAEELLNSISHGIGAGLGIAALVLCIVKSAHAGDGYKLASSIVFGLTTTLLYLMSCLYHALKVNRAKKVFRVFDHCTIFLLIAGTYTPYTLVTLRGPAGWVMFGIVWAVAITGVVLNAVNLKKFAKISVTRSTTETRMYCATYTPTTFWATNCLRVSLSDTIDFTNCPIRPLIV